MVRVLQRELQDMNLDWVQTSLSKSRRPAVSCVWKAEQNDLLPDGGVQLFIHVHEHHRRSIMVKGVDKSGMFFQT